MKKSNLTALKVVRTIMTLTETFKELPTKLHVNMRLLYYDEGLYSHFSSSKIFFPSKIF
jgi:hypothetical protein